MSHIDKPKILYIYLDRFSGTNASFLNLLKSKFPECEIVEFNVSEAVSLKYPRIFANFLWLRYRYKGLVSVITTKPFFDQIRRMVNKRIQEDNYVFTVQTQSLFDGSTPHLPHFIYTDDTRKVNLCYPGEFSIPRTYDKFLERINFFDLEQEIYDNATTTFVMGSHVRQSLIDHYHYDPQKVILIGAGPNMPIDKTRKIIKDYTKKQILFVGIEWGRKGGPQLIEAFKKVRDGVPDATLKIVGYSPDIDLPGVEVVGKVPRQDVQQFYEDATVFCMPSIREPFGIVYLEAMYNQLPLVALNIGALPELIKDGVNGYKVEYNDIDALANRLIELLKDPEKCKLFGTNSYEMFWTNWTWDVVGDKFRKHVEQNINLGTF